MPIFSTHVRGIEILTQAILGSKTVKNRSKNHKKIHHFLCFYDFLQKSQKNDVFLKHFFMIIKKQQKVPAQSRVKSRFRIEKSCEKKAYFCHFLPLFYDFLKNRIFDFLVKKTPIFRLKIVFLGPFFAHKPWGKGIF